MNALELAKQSMKWKEEWREKANSEADEGLHSHQVDMENLCRADASTYAAIATAEALNRLADATERRNQLLEKFNERAGKGGREHTEALNADVKKALRAFYGTAGKESQA